MTIVLRFIKIIIPFGSGRLDSNLASVSYETKD